MKVAVVDPAATVTEVGTVRTLAMAPEMETEDPPVGAAAERVTVQVVLPFEARLEAAHFREETVTDGAVRESEAVADELFREAVRVAV